MANETAAELLKQMKVAESASKAVPDGKASTVSNDQFYVKLRVLVLRRQQLTFAVVAGFIAFAILISNDYHKNRAWWLTGLPITAVGLMISLIPLSEEWEYKPWQARARQYERNQIHN